jgi:hypothetical protein
MEFVLFIIEFNQQMQLSYKRSYIQNLMILSFKWQLKDNLA